MENNELMERLLQDDKQQKSNKLNETPVAKSNRDNEIPMSRIRVVTAKYKVYIILLLIFICLLWLVYIPNISDSLRISESTYSQVNSQLDGIERSIRIAEDDINFLCDNENGLIYNENKLVDCLNNREGCNELPESWKDGDSLSIPVSYVQLKSLYNKKMPVDEKRVLKNLNEYLIKQDIVSGGKDKVGDILRISIGDPVQVRPGNDHFFKVSVDVQIEFPKIGDLTGFLYNVEKKLIGDSEDRILYKIQTVSYDIVTNNEPQVTDISMIAYYYHDEKFENMTVAVNAKVEGDKILLEERGGDGNLGDIKLKQEIKVPENREVEARDLFELPDGVKAEFNDGKGINKTKEGGRQKISVNILRNAECSTPDEDRNTYDDFDSGADEDSFFQKIFKDLKI